MKRTSACILLCMLCLCTHATPLLDSLVSKGNRAYVLGQRDVILQCAQSIEAALDAEKPTYHDSLCYVASMLKLYGNYHYENGALDSASFAIAEDFYDKASALNAQRLSTGHLLNLEKAQLYYRLKRYNEALDGVDRAIAYIDSTAIYEPGDAEWNNIAMQRAMCLARVGRFEEAIELADLTSADYGDRASLDYARALRMKAKILMLAASRPQEAATAYKSFFETQKAFAKKHFATMTASEREQYWLSLRPFVADCYTLEGLDPAFLFDVTLFAKGLLLNISSKVGDGVASDEALRTLDYRWADVRRRLKPAQAAGEFIQYEKDGAEKMALLLVKYGCKPAFIPLTSPDEVLALAGNDMRTTDRKGKDRLYGDEELRSLVFTQGLIDALKGLKRLYFAPDGYLHRLAIEYFPEAGKVEMFRLSSTRTLLEKRPVNNTGAALLCGGINYGFRRGTSSASGNDSTAYTLYRGTSFPRLSAESDESKTIYADRQNKADSLLRGAAATEDAFRALAPKFGLIMTSTHGDFNAKALPLGTDLKPTLTDNAMSENIIAFAGVNSALRNRNFDASNLCDGLLSARELSQLDLSNCRLFTLSACQTALGQITSDGVFGLQRGLKNAGVGAMLLSLWSVNSDATAMLMHNFFSNMSQGQSAHKAFANAREALLAMSASEEETKTVFDPATMSERTITKRSQSFNTPQYTDAFILIDALE